MRTKPSILLGLRIGLLLSTVGAALLMFQAYLWITTATWVPFPIAPFVLAILPMPVSSRSPLVTWVLGLSTSIVLIALGGLIFYVAVEADIRYMKKELRRLRLTDRH